MHRLRLALVVLALLTIGVLSAGCGNLLSVGAGVSCVIQSDGAPNCFGANGSGQAGHSAGTTPASPGAVTLPKGYAAADISVGQGSANGLATVCVVAGKNVTLGGSVYCWGDDTGGLLGRGSAGAASAAPVKVKLGTGNTGSAITVGGTMACALVSGMDAGVSCWGSQLGAGITAPSIVSGTSAFPVQGGGTSAASLLAVGQSHACAGGTTKLVCWGVGTSGQLGNGVSVDSATPVTVALPTEITDIGAITAGGASTCIQVTEKDGSSSAWCWGAIAASNVPTKVAFPGDLDAVQVSVGLNHACAMLSDATVWCWGANESGQLGNGTLTASATPVNVIGVKASRISAGQDQSCAAMTSGFLRCWGSNAQGQLGQAAVITVGARPMTVPGIDGLRAPIPKKVAIKGVAAVGSVLTATTAPWKYATQYTYQWQRLNAKGEWVEIAKATKKTLRPSMSLGGNVVRVVVSGGNAWTMAGEPSSKAPPMQIPAG